MHDKPLRNPTQVDQPADRRETKYQIPPEKAGPAPRASSSVDNRKIVGVLVSYTWRPEGQLFEVREGRTHIGAGQIKDDPEHRPVEVHCPTDDLLSGDHAVILVQQNEFYIQDLLSVNGTFLNGEKLKPSTVHELPSNTEIKAGKTIFRFVRFDPKVSERAETPRQETPKEEPKDRTLLR